MEVTAPKGTTVQEAANKLSALLNPKEETQEPDSIPTEERQAKAPNPKSHRRRKRNPFQLTKLRWTVRK